MSTVPKEQLNIYFRLEDNLVWKHLHKDKSKYKLNYILKIFFFF